MKEMTFQSDARPGIAFWLFNTLTGEMRRSGLCCSVIQKCFGIQNNLGFRTIRFCLLLEYRIIVGPPISWPYI